ncbi:hypothetical protein OHB12_29855 [Nocardia sp. NBC_01730]|nr:hypothetical protein OHB12_29855 [Nocardia sp. NBC_01730]
MPARSAIESCVVVGAEEACALLADLTAYGVAVPPSASIGAWG